MGSTITKKSRSGPFFPKGRVEIRGARQNNLKGFDLDLPLGKLTVVTGPSGSGKSSLAFDTIYAEGQRRYVETFSPYMRQFLERMDKPRVDQIRGIPPAIAIEQANPVKSSRSTVGTMTEINDYLKLLMPHVARAFCPGCGREIRPETAGSIADHVANNLNDRMALITFWVGVPAKSDAREFLRFLQQQGYLRIWLNREVIRTDTDKKIARLGARAQVIQDRLTIGSETRTRLIESIETALRFGKGRINFVLPESGEELPFSTGWHCAHCDLDIHPPTPGLFSFNSPLGACPTCRGFGRTIAIDMNRVIPDRSLSIASGVVRAFQGQQFGESHKDLLRACARQEIDVRIPFEELATVDQNFVINGEAHDSDTDVEELASNDRWYGVRGFFEWLESKTYKMHLRVLLSRYRAYTTCPSCNGGRFQPASLNYRVVLSPQNGKREVARTLPEIALLSIAHAHQFFDRLSLPPNDSTAVMLRNEVVTRLRYLCEVGLGYLTLDRSTRTLSGGEVQRVNLTTCLGASLVNTLFVMDEPSVGLHPRDVNRLVRVMHDLRDKGNTLVVVEHEEAIIRSSDNIIDLGPGRGEHGGELVFNGELDELKRSRLSKLSPHSLTADYLNGKKAIPIPKHRRSGSTGLRITGARAHNLKNLDVEIPLGIFNCVTGVSGSGKSTLVHDVLYRNLLRAKGASADEEVGLCKSVTGGHRIRDVLMVDQSMLARTPRSTPLLYLGLYDRIRELFAAQQEAMAQGLTASAFSFNSGSGRCERCCGTGFEKIEMQFLSDLYVRCGECEGRRFQQHVLRVRFHGRSIAEILQMTVNEAIELFGSIGESATLANPLRFLAEVGLGYLRLGQPLNTLSGGESQRLKLVRHLASGLVPPKENESSCGDLLIFDEPTTGLHFDDVAMLMKLFHRIVDAGNTIVVIEHNLEVIKCADWIIDLGPEAGEAGGGLVAAGTPETIARSDRSHTGAFLRKVLRRKPQVRWVETQMAIEDGESESARAAEERSGWLSNGARELRLVPEPDDRNVIRIHGAREHNLKNISFDIPRDKMVIITGLSGSGKSTVAFDILFAEGQRRFLDSMSPYARQFVEQLEKPEVDLVEGLPPSVAIEQRVTRGGGKSTVATVTEVYHFLRLLFAKAGTQFCPECDLPVEKQSLAAIVKELETAVKRGPLKVLAPLVKARKGFHTDVGRWAERQGFDTLFVDRELVPVSQFRKLERFKEHTIDVVVGAIDAKRILKARNLVERALEIGRGTAHLLDGKHRQTVVSTEMSCPGCGRAFEELDPRLFSFNSPHGACEECGGFGEIWNQRKQTGLDETGDSVLENELAAERESEWIGEDEAVPCEACNGSRLNSVARHVRLQGRGIDDFTALSASEALRLITNLRFRGNQKVIADELVPEISQRLQFMDNVGLGYLSLGRSAKTLSGGESQRIRLAAQLGSNLRGVLYVLDEPTIGLHPRDNLRLLDTLVSLREKGNSLVIVEHDEETMRRADHIIDLGPGAGQNGGKVVVQGTLSDIERDATSETGRCLRSPLCHPTRKARRPLEDVQQWLEIRGARAHNLKEVDVRFPVGRLSVITGISGSGKSTLMHSVLLPGVRDILKKQRGKQQELFTSVSGAEAFETVYEVDQSPIGKTSRSIPATYIKVFDEIRKLYGQLPVSRVRGYSPSRFSFNAEGGRCETCRGQGAIKLEMNFLPSSYVPCEDCGGQRYNPQTLEVLYNGKSIGEVMEMTIEQAAGFFASHQKIARSLSLLVDTGLGYLKLGQPSPTLSGGEAQRLKLVTELTRGVGRAEHERIRKMRQPKSTLYLLEEPTIGLHMADVELLLKVLHRLVEEGSTVIVIEHNLSIIAEADYVVDMGPEAGAEGGRVVAVGAPEEITRNRMSRTAPFLRAVLQRRPRTTASLDRARTRRNVASIR